MAPDGGLAVVLPCSLRAVDGWVGFEGGAWGISRPIPERSPTRPLGCAWIDRSAVTGRPRPSRTLRQLSVGGGGELPKFGPGRRERAGVPEPWDISPPGRGVSPIGIPATSSHGRDRLPATRPTAGVRHRASVAVPPPRRSGAPCAPTSLPTSAARRRQPNRPTARQPRQRPAPRVSQPRRLG